MYNLYFFVNSLSKEIKSFSFSSDDEARKEVTGLCGELYKEISTKDILEENFIISNKVCFFFNNAVITKNNFFLERIYRKEEAKKKKGGQFFIKIFFERTIAYKG